MRRSSLQCLALSFLVAMLATSASAPLFAQDWAKAMLEKSPRHREYVPLKYGNRTVQAFVAYPEVKTKAPVIVLIHEIFGLSDWAKEMADELAGQGYIVVAPDLLTGSGPDGGGTDSLGGQDKVVQAVGKLPADQVLADLDAAADYGKKLPSANGKVYVAGFCWGGGKSFAFATHRKDLSAAFVFYGPPPPDFSTITAPVYGFYAGNDARISATVPATTDGMKAAGKKYDPVIYDGAGHGFMRAGEDPGNTVPANKTARDAAFKKMVMLINMEGKMASVRRPVGVRAKTVAAKMPAVECHDMTPATTTAKSSAGGDAMAGMDMAAIM